MHFRTPLLSTLFLSTAAAHGSHKNDDVRPRQGVFSLSNQPNNQVGVWESLDDGALVWRGRYDTGGVGYPDPGDEENLDDLGSSNAIHTTTCGMKSSGCLQSILVVQRMYPA